MIKRIPLRLRRAMFIFSVLLFCACTRHENLQAGPDYKFTVETGMLRMNDGVDLAVTYYLPVPKRSGEVFPVLLEMVPYRKDDFFYLGDYEYGSWFAAHGYVLARVDVRGTGGSSGAIPDREYSDAEISDAVEIVDQLSRKEWSNGNVGMYGISWSGFNSLMTAARKPPALKAIIAAHASQDLYYNDVHYIDGVLHMDEYMQEIDTDNALPRSPLYELDQEWNDDRFEQEPWVFTYFSEQRDGPFWRRESQMFKPPLQVPAYVIGGLLDGYRDFVPWIFESSVAPVIGDIGPWNHAYPEYGTPGPNYEWRQKALKWWDYWLKGKDTGILKEPRFMVFVRDGHPPSTDMEQVPGDWRCEQTWPIPGTAWKKFYPQPDHGMAGSAPLATSAHNLGYLAGAGMAAGVWWGEQTPDMASDDAHSLVYDSEVLEETIEIIGKPKVRLKVTVAAGHYQWTVRLEDVWPDGKVSLVSGALINPSQRDSRLDPKPLVPGAPADLATEIHFTTWRFKPGHRIRIALSNAQFPMAWPTPTKGKTTLFTGADTWIELPVPPPPSNLPCYLPPPEKNQESPDGWVLDANPAEHIRIRDDLTGFTKYRVKQENRWIIGRSYFESHEDYNWTVIDNDPAHARFDGMRQDDFYLPGNHIDLTTRQTIESDELFFHMTWTKTIYQNSVLIKDKTWTKTIPRDFQ